MTREEAIIEIERIKNHGWCRTEALDMAIAALSAQPERVQSYWRLSDYQNEADVANRMSDYISRRAAQEEIARRDTTDGTVKVFSGREVNEILANLPSADVRPNVKGEWVKDELGTTVCSNCKNPRRDNRIKHIAFCNSCGAEMKGEKQC